VKLSLSLPFTKDEFTEDKQSQFRKSLAVAAGVKPADVKIDKIETIVGRRGAGRRLLAGSIRVDTSIRAADNAQAGSMAKD
jgi:butyrate kinase